MIPEKIAASQASDLFRASWTHGWRIGQEVLMSGVTAHPATEPAGGENAPPGTYEQTLVVLRKIEALLKAAGGHRHNIVKTVVYVTDIADKDEVSRARVDFFEGHYPCSTLIAVSSLVFPGLKVEIDAWARLDVDLRCATHI